MRTQEAVRVIQTFLHKNNYIEFKADIHQVLSDNRRLSKKANVKRYGKIPFEVIGNKVSYTDETINSLCQGAITYICEPLKKERLERAEKALEAARRPYSD